ncbi:Transcription initiation factor IID 18kDa subunit [Botryosphaeria dothidea]|uniref:Transcription initiation factor IID 18kDa subunit n=1 Tax=Botryosphaeria dothidea TaxID=55169 RepID=A0A8H4IK61_9PEZI|nr:Transcription initiation factor IID 18kDa subunit [Botryosphaeria dothidea]
MPLRPFVPDGKRGWQWREFAHVVEQMMFVSGETAEPSAETTTLIEQIVQQQVQEMLRECTILANRRGSRSISTDDLMMLIRHDRAKISRLRTFLQWKDVRKTAKDSDEKNPGADDLAADDIGVDISATAPNPATKTAKPGGSKKAVDLVWDVQSYFSEAPPAREEEEDEEETEMNYATIQRLRNADERTKNMTREEYVHWSDCRQASFTFRKGKRFREWAGFGTITDSKPNDDIIDILGFLTFEIVQTLTEEALRVKQAEDAYRKAVGGDGSGGQSRKRKRESGLFDPPEEAREPVGPGHVREAFRRLQRTPMKSRAMLNFTGLLQRTTLKLI